MRYHANISQNIINAYKSKDNDLVREIVLDEISTIIKENPSAIIEALKRSNVKVSGNENTVKLINLVAYALVNNPIFKKNIAVVLAAQEQDRKPAREEFASFGKESASRSGGSASSGGSGGGGSAVSSIANAVSSIFNFASATQDLKSEEEKAKAMMYSKIFGKEKKTNWMPVVVIAGVLLIGGLVVWRVTASKRSN